MGVHLSREGGVMENIAPAADGKLHISSSPHYHWPAFLISAIISEKL
jgi:hypothetical protein